MTLQPCGIKADIGVIVGRFQVDALHEAHTKLLEAVFTRHHKVVVLLGVARVPGKPHNALDYDCRRLMIQEKYPAAIIMPLPDQREDEDWSQTLDDSIRLVQGPGQTAVIYGGRDSCIPHYTGKIQIQELEDPTGTLSMSGSSVRSRLAVSVQATQGFRAGAIWQASQRFPAVVTTVDVAIIDKAKDRVLLVRKPKEVGLRFVGGFSDVHSNSFEHDAKREVLEETGVEVDDLQYLGSFNIHDWRMKKDKDQIRTLFYVASYIYGIVKAEDDVEEARWVSFSDVLTDNVNMVPEHEQLYIVLKSHIGKIKNQL